ncbi:MAG: flavin monoamine oxidase family protein [Pseudomonadota bacterium]
MDAISRRSFLTLSAGASLLPVWGHGPMAAETEIAIVGAGAAGIAAARKLIAAGRRVVLLEAADRIGGRCITDMSIFGVPFDAGAHWLHAPDLNPLAKLAPRTGLDIYPAPPGQKVRIGRRNAREGELEQFFATMVRARRAIEDAARGKTDISVAQAMPKDLGEWAASVAFYLGPFSCGKDFAELSVMDFQRSRERDVDAYCRQGYGALLARLAEGLPVQLATPVTRIVPQTRGGITIETAKGSLQARAVIVTVSTNVLAEGKLIPDLPKRQLDALARLRLGHYERIVLELPDNPFGLARDDLVFEKTDGRETAALLANAGGSSLAYVDIAGSFGRDLGAKGPREMIAFALEWLDKLFGADVKKAVKRTHATQWAFAPYVQGAFSAASAGGQPSRRILMTEPLRDRIFYAGEAAHETLWGTVGGAWESGERAADQALKVVSPLTGTIPHKGQPKQPAKKQAPPQRQPRQQFPGGAPRIISD